MTVPTGDNRTTRLAVFEGVPIVDDTKKAETALTRLQKGLFSPTAEPGSIEKDVVILSAPGESRECVEIARLLQREAEAGVPFDRMAVLLRVAALVPRAPRRGFASGEHSRALCSRNHSTGSGGSRVSGASRVRRPMDFRRVASPSTSRSAKSPMPPPTESRPAPAAESDRWVPPDEELIPDAIVRAALDDAPSEESRRLTTRQRSATSPGDPQATVNGTLRAPRLWERILVDAAVIGGRARWEKRLAGRRQELLLDQKELADPDEPMAARIERDVEALDRLRDYALPLLSELEAFASLKATWGAWLEKMSSLATRALRHPERVLSVLAELSPMADVGPVDLTEVRLVLERRLTELVVRPNRAAATDACSSRRSKRRAGSPSTSSSCPASPRRLFPQKVAEDPLLPDRERAKLAGNAWSATPTASADERLALRLAVGAASERSSSPIRASTSSRRARARPRSTASRCCAPPKGNCPASTSCAPRRSGGGRCGAARLARAADRPEHAIDEAEYDLALLRRILEKAGEGNRRGGALSSLRANPHLARALRFRARRWLQTWKPADGLVDPDR